MFYVCPASEWKEDIEWIAHHTHSDVKKYAARLVCDCSNKLALRKSKQPWSMLQKRVWIFPVDRPANIAWYQGLALVFTSAKGHKIPTLWGDEGDV